MEQKKRVIALGFFDGVHNGHGALMRRTAQVAQELGAVPSAFTFDPHPQTVILGRPMPLLTSPEDRAGFDAQVLRYPGRHCGALYRPRMKQPWQDFVASTLVKDLHAVHLVAGHDYHFGYKGEGNPQRLQQICQELGIGCDIIPKVEMEGSRFPPPTSVPWWPKGRWSGPTSSWAIPTPSATGWPTEEAGLHPGLPHGEPAAEGERPLPGQRGVCHQGHPGKWGTHLAVTNVGTRPTVNDGNQLTIEGYILDFTGDLYGQKIQMEFYEYLRERKFPSFEALTAEVMHNADQTREYFAQHP